MFYHAQNGKLEFEETDMDYICFGRGEKNLIFIPGLGDGLKTVKGTAVAFALMYRIYALKYRVFVFSRKNLLPEGYSTRDMANDVKEAMVRLKIAKADIIGVSQGGMIAQYLAIDYPAMVHKLILAVTSPRPNETLTAAAEHWIALARSGDYKNIFIDTAERSYTDRYLKKFRRLYPVLTRLGKPRDFDRFIIQADACIRHNAIDELDKIKCPACIIGADNDKIVGRNASLEIADRIEGSRIFIYPDMGHGVYEEAKDFNERVLNFLDAQ
ncbi:alpha/beta hydrolase [Anaerolentibacter hominis]|uniref:alpha/beta fold hydrolase n=1 Tax=Anaerolentibacter hominis TaxID=3079009 RepID=UPI0031B8A048